MNLQVVDVMGQIMCVWKNDEKLREGRDVGLSLV